VKFFADVSDLELSAIKQDCHGVVLPIRHGGGTNLKTAEALALGKWIVATSTALRGFEEFLSADGVVIADNPADFRHAIRQVLQRPPFELSETSRAARDALYWDRCFDDSELSKFFDDACGLAPRPNSQKRFDALDGNSPAAGRGGMSPAKASRLTIGSVER
jgi:glycosyltransferase involved in cell wall biosynthesis